jgi:hypothetical protein
MNKKIILFIIITLFAFSFSIYQYTKEFQIEVTDATGTKPNPGHSWSEMECDSSGLCVDSTNGRVGIGTASPSKKLEVNGDILVSGSYDVCNGAGACLSQINSFIGSQPIAGGTNHSRSMCTAAGGTLVSETTLANPICRFNAATCPSGWTKYGDWSTTTAVLLPSIASFTCNGTTCPACTTPIYTGSHSWANTGQEYLYRLSEYLSNPLCECRADTSGTWSPGACHGPYGQWAYVAAYYTRGDATITQIGCY